MQKLISFLKNLGVQNIYFGCGGRNEKLIDVFSDFSKEFFFDERVASFQALGHAKFSEVPVAVCVTSGSAVSECFNAVLEAYYSNIPLIVISGDRPERLRFTHAPQAINQVRIFGDYARTFINLPGEFPPNKDVQFPLHLNIEIDDAISPPKELNNEISPLDLDKLLANSKNPLVIITEGHQLTQSDFEAIVNSGVSFFIEVTANMFVYDKKEHEISYEITLNELMIEGKIDVVLKYGKTPICSLWRDLDRKYPSIPVISIGHHKKGIAHGHQIKKYIPKKRSPSRYNERSFLSDLLSKLPKSEAALYQRILNDISQDDICFVGNSMAIRYTQILRPLNQNIYASRGVNGIDGQVSTAIGMAKACPDKMVNCLIGDLTFLYDFNSLFQTVPDNLKIFVMNNRGGGIFKRVPTHEKMHWEHDINIENLIKSISFEKKIKVVNSDPTQTEQFWKVWNEN